MPVDFSEFKEPALLLWQALQDSELSQASQGAREFVGTEGLFPQRLGRDSQAENKCSTSAAAWSPLLRRSKRCTG